MSLPSFVVPLLLSATLSTFACGSHEPAPSAASPSAASGPDESGAWSLAVNSAADLAACSAGTEGRLAFIKTTNQFMACYQGTWGPIDLKAAVGSGTNGTNGTNGKNSLVRVIDEPAGTNCSAGGKRVYTGIDANGDSILAESEVTASSFICNALNGQNGSDGLSISSTWKYNFTGSPGVPQRIGETANMYTYVTDIELQKFTNGTGFATVAGHYVTETSGGQVYAEHFSQSFFLGATTNMQSVTRKFGLVAETLFQFQVQLSETPVFKAVILYNGSPITSVKTFSLNKQ